MTRGLYRRLPGVRRGAIQHASLWLAPDHLMSVRGSRVREEYKRYYLREIQAIVVANASNYHLSSRSIVLGCLIGFVILTTVAAAPRVAVASGCVLAALIAAWLLICAFGSCRCRIYTAVSRDELSSICRRWTARRFLNELTPKIAEVQGVMEGNWAAAINGDPAPAAPGAAPLPKPTGPARSWATDLLTASLLAGATAGAILLYQWTRLAQWTLYLCNVAEAAAAVAIFVQYSRGRIRASMQRLAVVALVAMGLWLYIRPLSAGIVAGAGGQPNAVLDIDEAGQPRAPHIVRQIEVGASALLGLVALGMVLLAEDDSA